MKVRNLPADTAFYIYDSSGKTVRILQETDYGNTGFINWDGKDSDGNYPANGVYICVMVDASGHKKAKKIAYLKN